MSIEVDELKERIHQLQCERAIRLAKFLEKCTNEILEKLAVSEEKFESPITILYEISFPHLTPGHEGVLGLIELLNGVELKAEILSQTFPEHAPEESAVVLRVALFPAPKN